MAYGKMVDSLKRLGRWSELITEVEKYLKRFPEFGMAYFDQAEAYFHLEREEDSVGAYEMAIKVNPKWIWSYIRIGQILNKQRRYYSAVSKFDEALKIDPEHTIAVAERARAFDNYQGSGGPGLGGPEAYCVQCRHRCGIKNAERITMKNGSIVTQGTCPECGHKVFRVGRVPGK